MHELSVAQTAATFTHDSQPKPHDEALTLLAHVGVRFTRVNRGGKAPVGADGHNLAQWQKRPVALPGVLPWLAAGNNVGMLCGHMSASHVVIDLDDNAGDILTQFPTLATTMQARRDDAPERTKCIVRIMGRLPRSRKNHSKGIEILATGGHAILCGTHASGAAIYLTDAPILAMTADEVDAIWRWVVGEAIDAPAQEYRLDVATGDAMALLDAAVKAGTPGNRNAAGFALARALRDNGYTFDAAQVHMLTYQSAVQRGIHEYTEREALATLRSTYARKPATKMNPAQATITAVELATLTGEIDLAARPEKTFVAMLEMMRAAGRVDDVALAVTDTVSYTHLTLPTSDLV